MSRLLYLGGFLTLLALWLGYHEHKLNNDHSKGDSCKNIKLGEENMLFEPDVQETLPLLLKTLGKFMDQRAEGKLDDPNPQGKFKRVQHPVSWGCLPATVEILPLKNSSDRVGLFAQAAIYNAMIRLSKNSFDPDNGPKVSSIALKIFGVKGPRAEIVQADHALRDANKDTQDFITVSASTLPLVVVPQELDTLHKALIWGGLPAAIGFITVSRPTMIPRVLKMLIKGMAISNPFLVKHYQIQPSKLGEGAVRVGIFPCDETEKQIPTPTPQASMSMKQHNHT